MGIIEPLFKIGDFVACDYAQILVFSYYDDDELDEMTIRSLIAICTAILLILGSGIIYIAWNNWWNEDLIGPGTFLTSRQQSYENLVGFSDLEINGQGIIVWANGHRYEGKITDGKQHG